MARSRRTKAVAPSAGSKRPRPELDLAALEDVDSDDESSVVGEPSLEEESEEEDEPLEAKKVRLARQYLDEMDAKSTSSSSSNEEEQSDDDRVGRKLRNERQKKEGTYERLVADKVARELDSELEGRIHQLRCHDLTPTCVAISGSTRAVSGSKDHSVVLWDIEKQVKVDTICQQWKKSDRTESRSAGEVLSVACSDDGRFAAIGKRDGKVMIFDIRSKTGVNLVKTFYGHKGPVTCLSFRSQSSQLFSGGSDRTIRHYNLQEMIYLETLYGHQLGVMAIDCYRKELPISVGLDRTARAWKLGDESHLIYRGGAKVQAADCVTVIKDGWFVTGHQDGHLSLWMTEKKKPVASIEQVHGRDPSGNGLGVVSVGCLRASDFVLSGSNDGYLRFWKAQTGQTLTERGLERIGEMPMRGCINSIAVGPKATFCVLAVGQEHRLGRWSRVAGAKNRLVIVKLRSDSLQSDDEASMESPNEAPGHDNADDDDDSSSSSPDTEGSD